MDQIIFTPEQLKLVFEFAEWLEEFARAKVSLGIPKKNPRIRFCWSVPRKTRNGEWYSNWTTEALWNQFLKWKEENAKGQDL